MHILVGFAAGSGPDVLARAVAAQLGADLGQNFIVENRPGANGTIATAVVAQAAPDGYTLLYTSDFIAPTPFIYKSLPYDVFKDLSPIATVGVLDGLLMLVNPSSPAHNVKEFIDYAKKNPRVLRLARHRQWAASRRRFVQQGDRAAHGARAVQGRIRGLGGAARRRYQRHVRDAAFGASAWSKAASCARSRSPDRSRSRNCPTCR